MTARPQAHSTPVDDTPEDQGCYPTRWVAVLPPQFHPNSIPIPSHRYEWLLFYDPILHKFHVAGSLTGVKLAKGKASRA